MRRRRYLATGGSLAAAVAGSTTAIKQRLSETVSAIFVETDDVELRIRETNAPVEGGALLEVTLEVENTGTTAVRPAIESFFDGELRSTVETTIDPSETELLNHFNYRVPPVAQDDEVTIRFETASDVAERTVDVLAIDTLDPTQTSPAQEITVQPGTTVFFEVEADTLGEYGGRTDWFVDEEYDGRSMGPWYGAYYGHRGADYWQTTFESTGTYEVTAAVGDDDPVRAAWTVTVTEDGVDSPTIEGQDPPEESLEVTRDETIELELSVAHPTGTLDRVVWWLGHADVILGESEIRGTEDTASLELDGRCHGCPIITWVIGETGTITSEGVWIIDEVDDPEAGLEVTILETNDPVDTGAPLEVTVEVENTVDADVTQDVDLIVGHDPERVDRQSVTVDGGGSEPIELEFTTAVVRRTQEFPVRVETEASADEVTVKVIGTEDI